MKRLLFLGALAVLLPASEAQASPPVELKAVQQVQTSPLLTVERARRAMDRWATWDESGGQGSGHTLWGCRHLTTRTVNCNISQYDQLWAGDRGTLDWQIRATLRGGRVRVWSTLFLLDQPR